MTVNIRVGEINTPRNHWLLPDLVEISFAGLDDDSMACETGGERRPSGTTDEAIR